MKNGQEAAIFVVRLEGSRLRRLTPWALDAANASWAPDGSKLAFNSYYDPHPGESANLFTIRPNGSGMKQITHFTSGAMHVFGPSWSPSGKYIVWHEVGSEISKLFITDAHGGNGRQLTDMPVGTIACPRGASV